MQESIRDRKQAHPSNNLPIQLTSFVGREEEIRGIRKLLDTSRSVTLIGTGGVGKTRLALESISSELERFPDGVWFVELSALFDPELVINQIYSELGLRGMTSEISLDDLSEYLCKKSMLLILDSCEHLVLACSRIAQHILLTCPGITVLSTSRELLGYPGEVLFQVPGLKLPHKGSHPDLEKVSNSEAVVLFLERIRVFQPNFHLDEINTPAVVHICYQLEGIPLALELAAARAKFLGVTQIADKLEKSLELLTRGSRISQPRQQTLRATIEWSYSLLTQQEQNLFRALSVFNGEFILEDVENVCSADSPPDAKETDSDAGNLHSSEILDLLSNLVDKSLVMVRMDPGAIYRLLIPIKQYAEEKLTESGQNELVHNKYLNHYLELAERAKIKLRGKEQMIWLDRLEIEHDNLRAAMGWSLESGSIESGLRLASALKDFWTRQGFLTEGVGWLEKLLKAEHPSNLIHANALIVAGNLNYEYGNRDQAKFYGEQGYKLFEKLGDQGGIARALCLLGIVAHFTGDRQVGMTLLENSLALFRELGDDWNVARTLLYLGDVQTRSGNYQLATLLADESLAVFKQLGDNWGIAFALGNSGELARRMGNFDLAWSRFLEGLELQFELGSKVDVCYRLESIAVLAVEQNDLKRAAMLLGAAASLRESIHALLAPSYQVDLAPYIVNARDRLGEGPFEEAWEQGGSLNLEQAVRFALQPRIIESKDSPDPTLQPIETPGQQYGLTEREVEILRLVAEGKTDIQVAERLFISPRTVGKHLESVYRKLQVNSRTAAARVALDEKIV